MINIAERRDGLQPDQSVQVDRLGLITSIRRQYQELHKSGIGRSRTRTAVASQIREINPTAYDEVLDGWFASHRRKEDPMKAQTLATLLKRVLN